LSQKISQLTSLETVLDADVLPVVNGGATKKVSKLNLLKEVNAAVLTKASQADLDAHTEDASIHYVQEDIGITESQVTDLDKYTQAETDALLATKAATGHNHAGVYEPANANIQSHIASTSNPHSVTKTQVGLGNVTNDAQVKVTDIGVTVASLSGGKIPTSQLPALALTDVSVVASQAAQLALTAEEGDVAVRTDLNKSYIHNGGTAGTMADWNELLTPTNAVLSVNGQTGAVILTKSDVGLANVDNTSDLSKPISTATQSALDAKLNLTGGTVTGALTVSGGTLTLSDNAVNAASLSIVNTGVTSASIFGITGPASTDINTGKAFVFQVSGESFGRGMFYMDGKYGIGSGSAARDTFISRSAASVLRVSSDGGSGTANLEVTGAISAASLSLTGDFISKGDFKNVLAYGAVGDGTTDDTSAINTAAAAAKAGNDVLIIPPKTYKITSTITFECDVEATGAIFEINNTTINPAIAVGSTTGYIRSRNIKLPTVKQTGKTLAGWSGSDVGIKIQNILESNVWIPHVRYFSVGILMTANGTRGNAYNTYTIGHLENNQVNFKGQPADDTSWFNQNTMIGGRYSHNSTLEGTNVAGVRQIYLIPSSSSASGMPNNNVFMNPSIEGNAPEYHIETIAQYNTFYDARFEATTPKVYFNEHNSTLRSRYNKIVSGYNTENIVFTESTNSVDNHVWSSNRLTLDGVGAGKGMLVIRNRSSSTQPAIVILDTTVKPLSGNPDTDYTIGLAASQVLIKQKADTEPRFKITTTSGRLDWGTGGVTAVDTNLYRSAADTLRTDDNFIVGGALTLFTDLAVTDGGTGASTAAAARTNLGVDTTTNITEGANLYYTDVRADARITLQKAAANGIATLGADSKIPTSQLPALALTDVSVVASQVAQLALTAEEGDVAVRTDLNKSYIHNGGVAGTMADWNELLTPTDSVLSVNGQTGAVTLTKSDVGLGNVDNTSDASKPISTATQTALDVKAAAVHTHDDRYYTETEVNTLLSGKSDTSHNHAGVYEPANANIQSHISSTSNPHSVTKSQVGLGNVDNTSDANKPISTATQTALDAKQSINMGATLIDSLRKRPFLYSDFVAAGTSTSDPFLGVLIASGTSNATSNGVANANHPGAVRFRSSTTTNSGLFIGTNANQLLLAGDEYFEAIFRIDTLALSTFRLGFHDTNTSSDAVDGAYVEIDSSGIVTGKTSSNSTRSSTATTYTASASTWYRLRVVVNSMSLVTFTLYNDSGTSLWTDTLTANIPSASGRETGAGVIATNSGTTAVDLLHLDYLAVTWGRDLTR